MRNDKEAMKIIRQAAVLLKSKMRDCKTPGCRYRIRFSDGLIAVAVTFPPNKNPGRELTKRPYLAEHWEDEIHYMLEIAISKIIGQIGVGE